MERAHFFTSERDHMPIKAGIVPYLVFPELGTVPGVF